MKSRFLVFISVHLCPICGDLSPHFSVSLCLCGHSAFEQHERTHMSSNITNIVKDKYGATAQSGLSSDDAGVRAVAEAFGYSAGELDAIPAAANMGLSCGNPTATANLR